MLGRRRWTARRRFRHHHAPSTRRFAGGVGGVTAGATCYYPFACRRIPAVMIWCSLQAFVFVPPPPDVGWATDAAKPLRAIPAPDRWRYTAANALACWLLCRSPTDVRGSYRRCEQPSLCRVYTCHRLPRLPATFCCFAYTLPCRYSAPLPYHLPLPPPPPATTTCQFYHYATVLPAVTTYGFHCLFLPSLRPTPY